jgi:hypothetical protein
MNAIKPSDDLPGYYADLLEGAYDCVDRIVVNAYFPLGQTGEGLRSWWRAWQGGDKTLSDAGMKAIAGDFARCLKAWCQKQEIPFIPCQSGEDKHALAESLLPKDPAFRGAFAVLTARAPAPVWQVQFNRHGQIVNLRHHAPWPYVQHYYFRIVDPEWGTSWCACVAPAFWRPGGLNGHEWVQRQGIRRHTSFCQEGNCDQDFLRKFVNDVTAPEWMEWFNGPVQQAFQSYGFFDPAGVFMSDNPAYEGSVVMWFDEHNHPVDYEKLTAPERKKAHRERCYKLVSLLHLRGDSYVYAGLAVVPGNAHEDPVLWELVDNFVRHVGRGMIKLLILDRGFIDGPRITRCKTEWGIDVLLPVKKNMDIWTDAWALAKQAPWQPWSSPAAPPKAPPPNRPEAIVHQELKRQKTLATQAAKEPPPPPKRRSHARSFVPSRAAPVGPNARLR